MYFYVFSLVEWKRRPDCLNSARLNKQVIGHWIPPSGKIMIFFRMFFGLMVSTSDCHPRGPGFDSRLYLRNFPGSIEFGMGST